jgi:hypothetical protein
LSVDQFRIFDEVLHCAALMLEKEVEERQADDGLCAFGCGEAVDHEPRECPAFLRGVEARVLDQEQKRRQALQRDRDTLRIVADIAAKISLPPLLLGIEQSAAYLGISPTTFKDHVLPFLPIVRIGDSKGDRKRVLFDRKDLDTWVSGQKEGGSFDFPKDAVARRTSSASDTTDSASREARVAATRERLLSKQRGSTRTS